MSVVPVHTSSALCLDHSSLGSVVPGWKTLSCVHLLQVHLNQRVLPSERKYHEGYQVMITLTKIRILTKNVIN